MSTGDTQENRPHVEGGNRSGGPLPIVSVGTDIAPPWLRFCECREATLLRAIGAGEVPTPQTPGFQTLTDLVHASAMRRIRQVSHAFAGSAYSDPDPERGSDHWHKAASGTSYEELERLRNSYDTPPRTPEQIRAQVAYSWRQS